MDKPQWGNPDNFSIVFRCMKQKDARPFFEKGRIKFGTPRSWVEWEKEHGNGRGDQFEGTLATFNIFDVEHAVQAIKKYYAAYNDMKLLAKYYTAYEDIEPMLVGNRCYLKRKSDMDLPCLCLYYLKNSMFPCPNTSGTHTLHCDIPASYFRDFADNATPEYVNGLPADDKPAVVIIKDYPAFKQRLIEKMLSLGIRREEIIEIGVSYIDFEQFGESGWWDFGQRSPRELAVKHIRFANQSEGRFIINTQRSEVRKMLSAPIEIGSLEDISQLCNQYFYDGIQVTSQVSVDEQP